MRERQAFQVNGLVQGVGFRPFVHALATRLNLNGFVKNLSGSVSIEVEGEADCIDEFARALQNEQPAPARIADISWCKRPIRGESGFHIEPSVIDHSDSVTLSADMGPCEECLGEMRDPVNRRYRYPFINCTNCGPRLTIIQSAPFDRERTTMAAFAMCDECYAEYLDPQNRRFHAQATCCPRCGPSLQLFDSHAQPIESYSPLENLVECILRGQIAALKGVGGYHLACDARNESAVSELRQRKHREEKPFALMVRDIEVAQQFCHVSQHECDLLRSSRRPIVLLKRRADILEVNEGVASDVAPDNPLLGVMLPSSPLHELLFEQLGDVPLVMTSGNRSHEPIAYKDKDAFERLKGIADAFLSHNRAINIRNDDSVLRVIHEEELPIRRSRGYAPEPIQLPFAAARPTLAVGGQLKGVFALCQNQRAYLSHHLGDLDDYAAFRAFESDIELYEQLFQIQPEVLVHDLHPDYASTIYAIRRAEREGTVRLAVQHHHAHLASCMAENRLLKPVIGVIFDGTGYGTDGAIWGGEFLVGDFSGYYRAGHLRYVSMPGGEKAIQQPWRMALTHMLDAGVELDLLDELSAEQLQMAERMIRRGFNSPRTSSMGRLFDAVAAMLGVHRSVSYEGQAAMQLEWMASEESAAGSYPFELLPQPDRKVTWEYPAWNESSKIAMARPCSLAASESDTFDVDTRPLIAAIAEDLRVKTPLHTIARRFHSTVVQMIVKSCIKIRSHTVESINTVALSGGVFLNAILLQETVSQLKYHGFSVYSQHQVPPGDGGICLGQLSIAAQLTGTQVACTGTYKSKILHGSST